jgi:GNAT superfamily N-acetyltransferase
MIEVRLPRIADAAGCAELAALAIGEERAGAFIRSHMERHHLVVAEADGQIVGFLAYRTDWFQCTFVTLVVVREEYRRKDIAREFFKSVEVISPTPRLFSRPRPTACRSGCTRLWASPSSHIDNLPQGTRDFSSAAPEGQRLTDGGIADVPAGRRMLKARRLLIPRPAGGLAEP